METKDKKIEYSFRNRTYLAVPELSKGCCVGCAFSSNYNCHLYEDRMKICRNGMIFKRKFSHVDD